MKEKEELNLINKAGLNQFLVTTTPCIIETEDVEKEVTPEVEKAPSTYKYDMMGDITEVPISVDGEVKLMDKVAAEFTSSEKEIKPVSSISTSEKEYQSLSDLEPARSKFTLAIDNVTQEKDNDALEFVEPLVS